MRTPRRRKLLWCLAAVIFVSVVYWKKKSKDSGSGDLPFDPHRHPARYAYPTTPAYKNQMTPPADFRAPECKEQHTKLLQLPPGLLPPTSAPFQARCHRFGDPLTGITPGTLPNTSVIFCFCNEPAKSLHNSMISVVERSPRHLLHEIVLVDDGSDAPHLQKPLEDFAKTLPVPVTIVRQGYRSGLMRARVAGAKAASGVTLTFLDSHISCSIGWLEPLMYRISQGRQHVVMPMIDGIDRDWNYKPGGVELVGFNTRLVDHGIHLQKAHKFHGMKKTDPQPSPAMAGGLFSMHRQYFFDMGAFDEGMLHWGGENIEIGFRVWQCGGSIELMSCSRVGHVWGGMGKNCGWKGPAPTNRNKWRAIEVWMDKEHQDVMREFLDYPSDGIGDVSQMVKIREKYQCKDFSWFLDKVYPECWINVLDKAQRKGLLRNVQHKMCLDPRATPGGKMVHCQPGKKKGSNTQIFYHSEDNELILNAYNGDIDNCLEAPTQGDAAKLSIYGCHHQRGNQEWLYDEGQKTLAHGPTGCLEASADGKVFVGKCEKAKAAQKWLWVSV